MKGFLSLLGITLIVAAFGLLLLTYSDTPLEDLKNQERMDVYMETRQNHTVEDRHSDVPFDSADRCKNSCPMQKKADSD